MKVADNISRGTLECEWVKEFLACNFLMNNCCAFGKGNEKTMKKVCLQAV